MTYNADNPLTVVELFAGYGSQRMALERLKHDNPGFDYKVLAVSEIEPAALRAYEAVHGDCPNLGDVSKVEWVKHPELRGVGLLTYSFPCFVKGTLIHTSRGYIPIEEVTTSDMVLTHTNNYQRVTAIGKREDAPVIKVRGMCFKEIQCTPEHPFYVRRRYRFGHKAERRFAAPEWLAAEKLTKDYYIGYAVNQKSELPVWSGVTATRWKNRVNALSTLFDKEDFWYVMGRYVGDGWKKKSKTGCGIVICCSPRNRESLLAAIERIGWNCTLSEERTVTKVIVSSNELFAFVDRYGYKAHGKMVDEETINLPIPLLRAFVRGYTDADGCFCGNEFKAASVSERLMYGMSQCITKAYQCPVRMYWTKRKATTVIEGRIVNQRDSYSLAWHIGRRKQDKAFFESGYVWMPIKEVVALNKTDVVYNLEVEADNSYTANGAIVHNCQDISSAGKQRGLCEGTETRSSLLWEVRRAVDVLRPRILLMENVKALLQEKFMPEFRRWQDALAGYGYTNSWQVLNARDYGVPQNRERVFMVSVLGGEGYAFPKPFKLEKRLRDILEPSAPPEYYLKDWQTERVLRQLGSNVPKQTQPINTLADGTSPALLAQYSKCGYSDMIPKAKDKQCASPRLAVVESASAIYHIGSYAKVSKVGSKVVGTDGISPAFLECHGSVMAVPEMVIGSMQDNAMRGSIDSCAPTLTNAMGAGGGNIPMVAVTEPPRRKDNITFKEMPNGNIRGVNGKGGGGNASEWQLTHPDNTSPTVTSSHTPKILAMRRDRKPPYSERRAEIQQGDWSNALTATGNERENLLLDAMPFRIRKLTPREAFRLMDVSEGDIDRIQAAGLSKTAQYKLAGNSIVVSCLYHLFRTMLIPGQPEKAPARQLSIF